MKKVKVVLFKAYKRIDRDLSRKLFLKAVDLCFSEEERPKKRACREDGKPIFIDRSEVKFSVSHSENWYLAAFCIDSEVGIDVEVLRQVNVKQERIAKRFFDPSEQEILKREPADFLKIWTKKEATVKLNGKGIGGLKSTDEDSKKLYFTDISERLGELCNENIAGTLCCEEEFYCDIIRGEDFNG